MAVTGNFHIFAETQNDANMDGKTQYVWFDWAMKHMLRNKANFEVLEGLISVMTGKKVTILEILESEGNQASGTSKYNRVDVKARTSEGEIVIIEVQVIREMDFMERILFGVANAITEQVQLGEPYSRIHKVYSISIVYFDLGIGDDYVYHGQTKLIGIHTDDELMISSREREAIEDKPARDVFPEYFIVRVRQFNPNTIVPNDMEQWMEYLKTGNIRAEFDAPGLARARETLIFDSMTQGEKKDYRDYVDFVRNQQQNLDTSRKEGREEGREEGLAEGMALGREEGIAIGHEEATLAIARKMRSEGMAPDLIERVTGIPLDLLS